MRDCTIKPLFTHFDNRTHCLDPARTINSRALFDQQIYVALCLDSDTVLGSFQNQIVLARASKTFSLDPGNTIQARLEVCVPENHKAPTQMLA